MTDQPSAPNSEARIIGWPCDYSLSPAMHNAAFAELGLMHSYVLAPTPPGTEQAAFDALHSDGVLGANVTVPHKVTAVGLVDVLDDSARRAQAVNTIVKQGSRLVGYNTDGTGFVSSLRADGEFEVTGRRCAILGAGGAARSIACALVDANAGSVLIVNRTVERASQCAEIVGSPATVGGIEDLQDADLIVNATSVGLTSKDEEFVGRIVAEIRPEHFVVDIVYRPLDTDLLVAARQRGARTLDGLSMLVHQAALSFQLWTGRDAPVATMRRAALAALAE